MSDVPISWTISVSDRVYGPYSDGEMRTLFAQGRIVPQSLVALSGETQFHHAGTEPRLSWLFAGSNAAGSPVPRLRIADPATHRPTTDQKSAHGNSRTHFVIFANLKTNSIDDLHREIAKLGQAMSVFPQIWILSTEFSIAAVRNALIQKLGKLDMLFVIDATNDKAAWFNFGPESSARIKTIWAKEQDGEGNTRAVT